MVQVPTPDPNACTITEAPPSDPELAPEDFALPGENGCADHFEVCMSRRAAVLMLRFKQYADENYAKCKPKQPDPDSENPLKLP